MIITVYLLGSTSDLSKTEILNWCYARALKNRNAVVLRLFNMLYVPGVTPFKNIFIVCLRKRFRTPDLRHLNVIITMHSIYCVLKRQGPN